MTSNFYDDPLEFLGVNVTITISVKIVESLTKPFALVTFDELGKLMVYLQTSLVCKGKDERCGHTTENMSVSSFPHVKFHPGAIKIKGWMTLSISVEAKHLHLLTDSAGRSVS